MKDRTGEKYTRLTVISFSHRDGKHYYWNCSCECGQTRVVELSRLTSGDTKSCGCYKLERFIKSNTTHGKSKTREYSIWEGIQNRCGDNSNEYNKLYFGRGIRVCDRWSKFENFFADMGPAPSKKYSLDRINNDGNYEPGNCRWATPIEQANNRRDNRLETIDGVTKTVADWIRHFNANDYLVRGRLRHKNWTLLRALTQPSKRHEKAS